MDTVLILGMTVGTALFVCIDFPTLCTDHPQWGSAHCRAGAEAQVVCPHPLH